MYYLTDDLIKKQCYPDDLTVLSQSDSDVKDAAELSAISLFRGYLKSYDVDTIFDVDEPLLDEHAMVMFLVDEFLYILYAAQPDRLIPDIRVQRHQEAIKWLEKVQNGKVSPDLPTVDTADATDTQSAFRVGYQPRVSSQW